MKYILRFIVSLLPLSIVSCKDEYTICNLPKDVRFIAGFYQTANVPQSAQNLSVSLLGDTSAIYRRQPNVPSFSLPLNPTVDSSKYLIAVSNSGPRDTLTIVYSSSNVNLSPECGNVSYHTITRLSSTLHTIDSVKLIAPAINTSSVQNAKIYF